MSLEILRGRGVLKAKILEAKYEAKLEFPVGRGSAKQKIYRGGEYGYFMELHIARMKEMITKSIILMFDVQTNSSKLYCL